ncbi:MAG: hypothetical protein KDJ80_05315 [Nitratireductor sp.]|nr:hypothetical protein [Nitratireductor sp.]
MMVAGAIVILGMLGANYWLKSSFVELDAANCPVTGPRSIRVVMIDRSDPISGQQALRIKQVVDDLADRSETGERFDFFVFEGDAKAVLEPVLSVCAPGKPEAANELYQNPEKIRRRYVDRFITPVKAVVDELTSENELPTSPILESLRAAALWSFGAQKSGAIPLRLTLVSDMIQNSQNLSHYKRDALFEDLRDSAGWNVLRPDLKGADVQILYLLRPPGSKASRIQNRGHQLFWEKLIEAGGGRLTGFDLY